MGFLRKLLGRGSSREERFWTWFSENSVRLHAFQADQERTFQALSRELNRVRKGLTFELGAEPEEDGRRRFVVSADGIRDRFPAVERLVRAAPELPGWQVVAFRQPSEEEFSIRMGDRTVDADDVWFTARQAEGKLDVTLYVRDLDPNEPRPLQGAVFILLDSLLGEYFVATGIGLIEWEPLPLDPTALRLRPLRELVTLAAECSGPSQPLALAGVPGD